MFLRRQTNLNNFCYQKYSRGSRIYERTACREFDDLCEFEVGTIPNGGQRMKVFPEFLPIDGRVKIELRPTVNFGPEGQCVCTTCRFQRYIYPNASKYSVSNKYGFIKVVLGKEADFYDVCSTTCQA